MPATATKSEIQVSTRSCDPVPGVDKMKATFSSVMDSSGCAVEKLKENTSLTMQPKRHQMCSDGRPCCMRLSDAESIRTNILDSFDGYIFDIDGVLLLGSLPVPKSSDTVRRLIEMGKKIFVFTNNSFVTPEQIQQKLVTAGYPTLPVSNIYGSSKALAIYFKTIDYQGKVYMLGNDSMHSALHTLDNVEVIRGDHHTGRVISPYQFASDEFVDESIGAVAMGFDQTVNYYKIADAHRILTQNPNSIFVSTNKDAVVPTGHCTAPGTGTFICALEYCSGRTSIAVGKPSTIVAEEILRTNPELTASRLCMLGDNLKTDILFGRRSGIGSILVETGLHKFEDARGLEPHEQPHFVLPSVGALFL